MYIMYKMCENNPIQVNNLTKNIALVALVTRHSRQGGAVVVWVAAEYVFGVMMGVLSEHQRLILASYWLADLNTVF